MRQIEKSLKAGGLKGNKRNNQKLHESGVEVEMLETQKGAVANRRSEEKNGCYSRGSMDIGNLKTGVA